MRKIIVTYELNTKDIPTVVIAKENEDGTVIQTMHTISGENGIVEIEVDSQISVRSKKKQADW